MDFSCQKFPNEINIPMIVNKLLQQQQNDKAKKLEKYYAFIQKNNENSLTTGNENIRKTEFYNKNYMKIKRTLYDHTKSLRHCDCAFSITTILSNHKEKPFSVSNHHRSKTRHVATESFQQIMKKTEKILKGSLESPEKNDNKSITRLKILPKKKQRPILKNLIEIPSARAQTILPSSRKKALNMVDQEMATDYQNIFSYM